MVSVSQSRDMLTVILVNPVMIDAYQAGVPGNGKPFPDGSKMAKIHWNNEKECRGSRSDDGAGHPARRRFHGQG